MADGGLFIVLFSAIAIGWGLGRFTRKKPKVKSDGTLNNQYVAGINFLLNDQPDGAIDAFIASLEVNSETLETHLAIGNLSRRRGEADRAIRVHQNLLARPSLSRAQRQLVQYELALDYMKAGWLDRAERILRDLLAEPTGSRQAILRSLIDIYQQEQEWEQALPLARELISLLGPGKARATSISAAHYSCELAQIALDEQRLFDARAFVKQAFQLDPACVRASILSVRTHLSSAKPRKALAALKRINEQDPAQMSEALPEIRATFEALGNKTGVEKFLRASLERHHSPSLVLAIYEEVLATKGSDPAFEFLVAAMQGESSPGTLLKVLEIEADRLEGEPAEILSRVKILLSNELMNQPQYRCGQCGFGGQQLHWLCPSCKSWGTISRIQSKGVVHGQ